jgi:hypothetical protein
LLLGRTVVILKTSTRPTAIEKVGGDRLRGLPNLNASSVQHCLPGIGLIVAHVGALVILFPRAGEQGHSVPVRHWPGSGGSGLACWPETVMQPTRRRPAQARGCDVSHSSGA